MMVRHVQKNSCSKIMGRCCQVRRVPDDFVKKYRAIQRDKRTSRSKMGQCNAVSHGTSSSKMGQCDEFKGFRAARWGVAMRSEDFVRAAKWDDATR